jgi:hypothetical protein
MPRAIASKLLIGAETVTFARKLPHNAGSSAGLELFDRQLANHSVAKRLLGQTESLKSRVRST